MSNIVGEKFEGFVKNQIQIRQKLLGKGLNSNNLSNQDLNIINNRNAWLKLASSVEIGGDADSKNDAANITIASNADLQTSEGTDSVYTSEGEQRLRDIGLSNTGEFTGVQLAKKSILFNTLSELKEDKYNFRSGINPFKSIWNDSSYGLGGNEFGMVPAPGLVSAKIDTKNRGSLRGAEIEIIAYNKFQFELIELLYLRLGFTMMLEWGWDKYKANDNTFKKVGNTLIEKEWFKDSALTQLGMMKLIQEERSRYDGNYDGFFGKVSNFSWDFAPNGTYNITLKLISVGDVIESLKVNTVAQQLTTSLIKDDIRDAYGDDNITTEEWYTKSAEKRQKTDSFNINLEDLVDEANSSIISQAGSSIFGQRLYTDLLNVSLWNQKTPTEYYNLAYSYGKVQVYTDSDNNTKYANNTKYQYYMTVGKFLEYVEAIIVPGLKMRGEALDNILKVDVNEDESICAAYPLQCSLDPRVCLINPDTDYDNIFSDSIRFGTKNTVKRPLYLTEQLKQFIQKEEIANVGTVMYGSLLNIYLNYELIGSHLKKSSDKKGNLNLFKFLEGIFDDVNVALGGQNNLTVTLKDDVYITITEQNPIPGIHHLAKFKKLVATKDDPVDFNLYGFNSSAGSFVTDFGFETKITPDLASMISIGAAAGNSNIKNYDATAFSKWNNGLKDRYSQEYIDPSFTLASTNTLSNATAYKFITTEEVKVLYNAFNNSYQAKNADKILVLEDGEITQQQADANDIPSTAAGLTVNGRRKIASSPVVNQNAPYSMLWSEYLEWINDIKREKRAQNADTYQTREEAKEKAQGNYLFWLVMQWGGIYYQNGTSIYGSTYFEKYVNMIDSNISQGKAAWKSFINDFHQQVFQTTGQPSNTIGFIPIDMSLKCDGISGIKIYNGLNVNQEYLPPAYPTALNFIIKSLDHDISDNSWSTSLGTMSVPHIEPTGSYKAILDLKGFIGDVASGGGSSTANEWTGATPNGNQLAIDALWISDFQIKGNEHVNGGDITKLTALATAELFKELEDLTEGGFGGNNFQFRLTAGNDQFHHNKSPNSNHTKGWKIDFTYKVKDENESEFSDVNDNTQYIYEALLLLGEGKKPTKSLWEKYGFVYAVRGGFNTGYPLVDASALNFHKKYPFKALDEYNNPTSAASAPHFDIEFYGQTEQWDKNQDKIIPKPQSGG